MQGIAEHQWLPCVKGIALKSYFPKLKAHQLKKIIIDSGIKVNSKVMLDYDEEIEFDELSKLWLTYTMH